MALERVIESVHLVAMGTANAPNVAGIAMTFGKALGHEKQSSRRYSTETQSAVASHGANAG